MINGLQAALAELINARPWDYALITGDSIVAEVSKVPKRKKTDNDKLWVTVLPGTKVTDDPRRRGATLWIREFDIEIRKCTKQVDEDSVDRLVDFGEEVAAFVADESDESITKSLVIEGKTYRRVTVEHEPYDREQLELNTFVSLITVTYREM